MWCRPSKAGVEKSWEECTESERREADAWVIARDRAMAPAYSRARLHVSCVTSISNTSCATAACDPSRTWRHTSGICRQAVRCGDAYHEPFKMSRYEPRQMASTDTQVTTYIHLKMHTKRASPLSLSRPHLPAPPRANPIEEPRQAATPSTRHYSKALMGQIVHRAARSTGTLGADP